jgi:selenide,water dikinase
VRDTLQSESDPLIFAAGDCASMVDQPLEKAGVSPCARVGRWPTTCAARCSPAAARLSPASALAGLISTGDRYAIASRGGCIARGAWVWRWKDWIDRRFMRRFNDLPAPMAMRRAATRPIAAFRSTRPSDAGHLGDCHALRRLRRQGRRDGAVAGAGGGAPARARRRADRLACSRRRGRRACAAGQGDGAYVDFFRAFIDDPWLFGRIAANHALGDIFAMGGEAQSATAIATVPPGLESKVEETLFQMMSGAVEVLNEAGCALVGGHSGEGRELALGFAINGLIDEGWRA